MDCIDIKNKLDQLLDGLLPADQAKEVRTHLKRCPDCRREYNLLRMVAGSVAALPLYQPGRQFNDRVLAALGFQPLARPAQAWTKWLVGAGAPLAALWTGLLAYVVYSRLSVVDALRVLQLAARPRELLSALCFYAVKLGFAVNDAARFAAGFVTLAVKTSSLPLQLGLASLIAFSLILLLGRRTGAASY
ncbi:MAG TPA: zf-HC2 domain-containing protein [Candidatus Edwardsbacteria bacterium]|nr:zf-HC2 domain-containing protein [Candidatus Edwardsbacteria bacterium]